MKQGTLITRIMIVLMFFMICAYLLFSALRSLDDRTYTVAAYAHTVDDAVEATGPTGRDISMTIIKIEH